MLLLLSFSAYKKSYLLSFLLYINHGIINKMHIAKGRAPKWMIMFMSSCYCLTANINDENIRQFSSSITNVNVWVKGIFFFTEIGMSIMNCYFLDWLLVVADDDVDCGDCDDGYTDKWVKLLDVSCNWLSVFYKKCLCRDIVEYKMLKSIFCFIYL